MQIAFDLDDTLIPTIKPFSIGSKRLCFPLNLFFREALRNGAVDLLRKLSKNHELWIYTTSLRNKYYLKLWFLLWGIKITSIINQYDHNKAVENDNKFLNYSKAPGLFGIDLLIDDLPGVEMECKMQNCKCLIIDKVDENWTDKILSKIEELS